MSHTCKETLRAKCHGSDKEARAEEACHRLPHKMDVAVQHADQAGGTQVLR